MPNTLPPTTWRLPRLRTAYRLLTRSDNNGFFTLMDDRRRAACCYAATRDDKATPELGVPYRQQTAAHHTSLAFYFLPLSMEETVDNHHGRG